MLLLLHLHLHLHVLMHLLVVPVLLHLHHEGLLLTLGLALRLTPVRSAHSVLGRLRNELITAARSRSSAGSSV